MEAFSLASVNRLAANPPAYPTNPSEDLQEPLTLYISRVPGTRDVILSPFKPQVKNVTGEDVASCLYYVHLDLPPSDSSEQPSTGGHGDDAASIRTIHRKPLPNSAHPSTLPPAADRPPQTPSSSSHLPRRPIDLTGSRADQTSSQQTRNRGISVGSALGPHLDSSYDPYHLSAPSRKASLRKPVGSSAFVSAFAASLADTHGASSSAVPQRFSQETTRTQASSIYERAYDADAPSPKKRDATSTPFTLNLIRRDPGTGSQWNVGRISSYQIDKIDNARPPSREADVFSTASSTYSEPKPIPTQHPPINIQIETSGYARFRDAGVRGSLDLGHASAAQVRASLDGGGAFSRKDANLYFSRQVAMTYSKSWASNLKEKFQQASRKKSHGRSESQASSCSDNPTPTETPPAATAAAPETTPSQDGRMKARGYAFQSPWDKKCEFRTGHGGRSVQCRHILNDSQTVLYNPLVADPPQPSSVIVSELRFNLPAADLFPPSESPGQVFDAEYGGSKLGHFSKFLKSAAGYDREDEADEGLVSPFEVNIGAEKAGGGARGTRAKLGKLIIYHDGLKMLDLVVAANIGLWWGAWEKTF